MDIFDRSVPLISSLALAPFLGRTAPDTLEHTPVCSLVLWAWHRHKVTHLTANDYAMPYMMLSLISHQVLSFSDLVRHVQGPRGGSELRPGSKARRLCSPTCTRRHSESLRPKTFRGVGWERGNCTRIQQDLIIYIIWNCRLLVVMGVGVETTIPPFHGMRNPDGLRRNLLCSTSLFFLNTPNCQCSHFSLNYLQSIDTPNAPCTHWHTSLRHT